MCDDRTDQDLGRRELGIIAASIVLATAFPANAAALGVMEHNTVIATADGSADAYFVAPAKGRHPAVLIWPDIYGLRPAFQTMAKRLAESGYAVLVVNPFYRSVPAPIFAPNAPFDAALRAKVQPMRALLTPDAIARDAKSFIAYLDAQKSVDRKRKVGTMGYCMGGALTFRTAAAVPSRVGACASFHGGGLVTAEPDSPHLLIPATNAKYLIAIADNDDKQSPDDKVHLRTVFDAASVSAEIAVYAGAMHGWCVIDSQAYNQPQAEIAWDRTLALFRTALQ